MDLEELLKSIAEDLSATVDLSEITAIVLSYIPGFFGKDAITFYYYLGSTLEVVVITDSNEVCLITLDLPNMYSKKLSARYIDRQAIFDKIEYLGSLIETLASIDDEADGELVRMIRIQDLWSALTATVVTDE